ncbi:Transcription factor VBP [Acipenser ruthenus]|uniref:Transcription factor VBP n=1 Tax=Acipenser ruthenus TaxID=7906 RepID=A0A444UIN3_ACIRT|nr:Transcription factor VBP [Acipenser ruthenus]
MESTEPAELGSGPPGSIPGVLKKLLENPPPPKFLEENGHEPVLSPSCPSPVDPDRVEVQVDFQPDPADLVLSTVPGGELFNPRVHRFSEDELKPQPMIKKAKKVFVPEEKKYWSRRSKNNVAAKRSRDARRLKENQITVRAAFLEKENAALRAEVAELRRDCGRSKNELAKYRDKYGPL